MAYCVVNGVQYGAVANLQLGVKGAEQLMKDVAQNVELSPMPELDYQTIVFDLVCENYEFPDWKAIAREIEIRRVGYAVEATMRGMYDLNRSKDETYQANIEALAKREKQVIAAQENPETKLRDDQFAAATKEVKEAMAANEATDGDILRWSPTTFPNYSYRDKQVMEWWLGLRNDEPKRANCWESVLMALVNTKSLNVPKGYMIWCVEQIDTEVFEEFNKNMRGRAKVSRLYSQAVKHMDYYFPRYDAPVIDSKKERLRPREETNNCFELPVTKVIPRGRLLIFDYMTHVGISTGTMVPITTEAGRNNWKRNVGHGILDLNAIRQTIRERAIEDFVCPTNCNNQLIVAPFPVCNESGTIAVRGMVPPTAEEIDAYRKSLDKEAAAAYEDTVKSLEATRKAQKDAGKLSDAQIEKKYKFGLLAANTKYENAVVAAAKKIDKKFNNLKAVQPTPKEENFTLEYKPFDPYNGKVTF